MSILDDLKKSFTPLVHLALGDPLGALYTGWQEHEQRKRLRDADRQAQEQANQQRQRVLASMSARGLTGSTTEAGAMQNINSRLQSIRDSINKMMKSQWQRGIADVGFYALTEPDIFRKARNIGGIWRDIQSKGINYFTKSPQVKYRNQLQKGNSFWQYPYF